MWFREPVASDEVTFDSGVRLLTKGRAEALKTPPAPEPETTTVPDPDAGGSSGASTVTKPVLGTSPEPQPPELPASPATKLRVHGAIPAEIWNRVGTRLIPKLRAGSGGDLRVDVSFELTTSGPEADALRAELRQILEDLRLTERMQIDAE